MGTSGGRTVRRARGRRHHLIPGQGHQTEFFYKSVYITTERFSQPVAVFTGERLRPHSRLVRVSWSRRDVELVVLRARPRRIRGEWTGEIKTKVNDLSTTQSKFCKKRLGFAAVTGDKLALITGFQDCGYGCGSSNVMKDICLRLVAWWMIYDISYSGRGIMRMSCPSCASRLRIHCYLETMDYDEMPCCHLKIYVISSQGEEVFWF